MTPRRVVRRRHGLLAALAAVLFVLGMLGIERRDDAWLLLVGGHPVDLRGALQAGWQQTIRDCSMLERLEGAAPSQAAPAAIDAALAALREFSPPDSRSARLLGADVWHGSGGSASWVTLQAAFNALEAVVVLVRLPPDGEAHVVPEGVWSGTTRPWNAAWRIRGFLASRVPEAPAALVACLDPAPVFSQPPRPL